MSWNPLTRRSPIGIDVTPRFIHAAQLSGGPGGRWRLEALLSLSRRDAVAEITDEEIDQVAEALPRRGFQGRRVVLCMPGEHVITEVFRSAELNGVIPGNRELCGLIARAHRCDAEVLECASWCLPAAHEDGPPAGIMAVACAHDHAERYIDAVQRQEIQICGLDVRCQALTRAGAGRIEDPESLSAMVDLGWTEARLVVLCGSVVIFERTLSDCGLNRLQLTLTGRLGLEQDIAEYVLGRIGLGGEDSESEIASSLIGEVQMHVESYAQRLVAELKRSFSYAVQEYPERSFAMVALVGEGAIVPGLTDVIGKDLGVRTLVLAPADIVECPAPLRTAARSPLLTVAAGLAMYERG